MKSNTGKYLKLAALVWSCCVVVFALVFIFVLLPQKRKKITVESEYRKIESNASEAFLASQEQTKIRLNELIEQLNERLGSFVVDPGSTSNLTYEISGISNEIGLNSFRIAPMSESIAALEDCKYVSGQFYHVSFTSSFNQFATFINALERYRPFIFVDTFSISQSRQGNQEHDVQMQLAILVAKSDKAKEGKG
jgi:hypothetical protein